MDLVSKPQSSAPVWEHFGFKPNERGEPINVNEPVCRLCLKTVATKRGNTNNLKSHLKHNHPTQFFNLGTTTAAGAGEGSSRQLSVTGSGVVEGIRRYTAYTHFFISRHSVYPLLNPV